MAYYTPERIRKIIDEECDGAVEDFAQRLKISRQTVYNWLKSKSVPRASAERSIDYEFYKGKRPEEGKS